MTFDKKAVFAAFAPRVTNITVAHGGKEVQFYVKELNAKSMFDLQEQHKKEGWTNETFSANLLSAMLCDEDGEPAFTTDDVHGLMKWNYEAFNTLSTKVAEVAGLRKPVAANGADGAAAVSPNA